MKLAACLAAAALALAACGGGSGGGSDPNPGSVTFALVGADSLELSVLRLEVTEIWLRKASGQLVEVLAGPVLVDPLALEGAGQILGLATLPAGDYTHVRVGFGFSSALAHVVGSSTPAALSDWEGIALPAELMLPVAVLNGFQVIGGRHRLVEIELDIDQSARVDQPNNAVSIEPVFVLRIDPSDPRGLLVDGRLEKVKGNVLELGLEDQSGLPLQTVRAAVEASTAYRIDGATLTGSTGLAALAALSAGTAIRVHGSVDPQKPLLRAPLVEAGTGTHGGGLGLAMGHVIGRVGTTSPTLTVYGVTEDARHTFLQSDVIVTVYTDENETGVVPYGATGSLTLDDLNVGQRVRAYGTLAGTVLQASQPGSVVQIESARTFGLALSPPSAGTLVLDLERVDALYEASFQWREGGSTPLDPTAMIASVGTLAENLGIGAGTPVEQRGRFSAASESLFDYTASAVENPATAPALFLLQNHQGGADVSATIAPGQVQLAFSGALGPNEFARIDRGYLGSTALPLTMPFTAVGGAGTFLYRDRTTGFVGALPDFADLTLLLNATATGGAELYFFGARGLYDEATSTMQVTTATVMVE